MERVLAGIAVESSRRDLSDARHCRHGCGRGWRWRSRCRCGRACPPAALLEQLRPEHFEARRDHRAAVQRLELASLFTEEVAERAPRQLRSGPTPELVAGCEQNVKERA